MPHTRLINPDAAVDEDVATMPLVARYVWAFLPCHADREGRLKDSPFNLRLAIMPTDDVDMDAVLTELAARRHILRYEVDGRKYIQIRSFTKHQRPHDRETKSKIPPPPVTQGRTEGPPLLNPIPPSGSPEGGQGTQYLIRDLDPDLDQKLDQEGLPPPDRWMTDPEIWGPTRWSTLFGRAWSAHHNVMSYGGINGKSCGQLGDVLDRLSRPELLDAQQRAPMMFAVFFSQRSPKVLEAKHPFAWFVASFDALRIDPATAATGQRLARGSGYPVIE